MRNNPQLINDWNLLEEDGQGKNGLGTKVKGFFRSVACKLRSFHKAKSYCGNMFKLVRIQLPDFLPIFPYHPHVSNQTHGLVYGIRNDIKNFRSMVAQLVTVSVDNRVLHHGLSLDLEFFLSKIFTRPMAGEIQEVIEYSIYQLHHPVFFDGEDRLKFFVQLMLYRSKYGKNRFDWDLNLSGYRVNEFWEETMAASEDTDMFNGVLKPILIKTKHEDKEDSNCHQAKNKYSFIPRFIRNVHLHFHDYELVCIFIFGIVIPRFHQYFC